MPQSRSQGRAPPAPRAGSPCACGAGAAPRPPPRRGHPRRLRPRRRGGWLLLGSWGLGGDEFSGVGVDVVKVGVMVVVVPAAPYARTAPPPGESATPTGRPTPLPGLPPRAAPSPPRNHIRTATTPTTDVTSPPKSTRTRGSPLRHRWTRTTCQPHQCTHPTGRNPHTQRNHRVPKAFALPPPTRQKCTLPPWYRYRPPNGLDCPARKPTLESEAAPPPPLHDTPPPTSPAPHEASARPLPPGPALAAPAPQGTAITSQGPAPAANYPRDATTQAAAAPCPQTCPPAHKKGIPGPAFPAPHATDTCPPPPAPATATPGP